MRVARSGRQRNSTIKWMCMEGRRVGRSLGAASFNPSSKLGVESYVYGMTLSSRSQCGFRQQEGVEQHSCTTQKSSERVNVVLGQRLSVQTHANFPHLHPCRHRHNRREPPVGGGRPTKSEKGEGRGWSINRCCCCCCQKARVWPPASHTVTRARGAHSWKHGRPLRGERLRVARLPDMDHCP